MLNFAIDLASQSSRTRLIWGIIILVLFIFVVLGVIGMLITRLMRWQGKAVDKLMYKVTITKVIQNKRHFRKIANIKSNRYFFKQAWLPFVLMFVAALFIILYCTITNSWGFNIASDFGVPPSEGEMPVGGTGIATILYLWDFSSVLVNNGISVILSWPTVINVPHLSGDAWPSYVFWILFGPALAWFLVVVQCFVARVLRIFTLGNKIYDKNLENFRYDEVKNIKNIDLETLVDNRKPEDESK